MTPLDAESKSIIEDTLLRFVEERYHPAQRRKRLKPPIDYRLNWATLADLGVLGMPFDEALGGLGGCSLDVADAVRVLAKGLILEPFVQGAVIAGTVFSASTDTARRDAVVGEVIAGENITVVIGGRPGSYESLQADKTTTGWRLNGKVRAAVFAAEADNWLIVARQTSNNKPVILYAPRSTINATIQQFRLMDGRSASDVKFADVDLAANAMWLIDDAASVAVESAYLHSINAFCADAVGCMEQLLAITGEYLKTRVQFGVMIGSFQALQHRFADMHMLYMEARAISRSLAVCLDGGTLSEQRWRAFSSFSVVRSAGTKIGHEAMQMHGGMGMTEELIVSHYNYRLVTLGRMLRNAVSHDITPPALATAREWI